MIDKFGVLHCDYPDLELPKENIWQYAYPRFKKWGNLTAFIMSDTEESLTFKELIGKALCWAKEIKKYFKGSKAPKVSFAMRNNIDCFPFFMGSYAVGATVCPFRFDLNCVIFKMMVTLTKPDIIVMDPETYERYRNVVTDKDFTAHLYIRGTPCNGMKDFSQVLNSGDELEAEEAGQYDSSKVAVNLFSSGTTATPKCIVISHQTMVNWIYIFQQPEFSPFVLADKTPQETVVGNLPLAHMTGIVIYSLLVPSFGNRVVYIDVPTIPELLSYVEKYQPVSIRIGNIDLEKISKLEDVSTLRCLKSILLGGSPSNINTLNRLNEKLGNKLFFQDSYGSTEAGPMSGMPRKNPRLWMSGKLFHNCKAKFIDLNTGEPITEPHKNGEILFKGPGRMDLYLNNPEATRKAIDEEGWLHTGDIGFFDEDYYIKVIDRIEDLIISCIDGKVVKVSPIDIEKFVLLHPDVMEAGVVGVPDPLTGKEVVKAFVVKKGNTVDEKDIIKFMEENAPIEMRLTGGIVFVESLPKNPMGKLVRRNIRDMGWVR